MRLPRFARNDKNWGLTRFARNDKLKKIRMEDFLFSNIKKSIIILLNIRLLKEVAMKHKKMINSLLLCSAILALCAPGISKDKDVIVESTWAAAPVNIENGKVMP